MNRTELERALSAELAERASALDQPPDYEDLGQRLAEPPTIATDELPADERRVWSQPLTAVAVAAVLVVGLAGLVLSRNDSTSVDVATAATTEPTYYWPSALPPGWSLIEAGLVDPVSPIQDYGVVAAVASEGRFVVVEATLETGPNVRRPQTPQFTEDLDGLEVDVIYVDERDAVIEWTADGHRFQLWGRLIHLPEAFRLAAGVTASHDSSGVITDLDVPIADDFEIIVDRQPATDPTNPTLVFRFECPGEECRHALTIGPPALGSAEFARTEFTLSETVTHETEHGEILFSTEAIGTGDPHSRAMTILENGEQATVQLDTGPIGSDPHGQQLSGPSPLDVDDVETIVAGLDPIGLDRFVRLAAAANQSTD